MKTWSSSSRPQARWTRPRFSSMAAAQRASVSCNSRLSKRQRLRLPSSATTSTEAEPLTSSSTAPGGISKACATRLVGPQQVPAVMLPWQAKRLRHHFNQAIFLCPSLSTSIRSALILPFTVSICWRPPEDLVDRCVQSISAMTSARRPL